MFCYNCVRDFSDHVKGRFFTGTRVWFCSTKCYEYALVDAGAHSDKPYEGFESTAEYKEAARDIIEKWGGGELETFRERVRGTLNLKTSSLVRNNTGATM